MVNTVKLSKTVSYILRHYPEDFGLKLAADGSVDLAELTAALQQKFPELEKEDLIKLVESDPKGRFSLPNGGKRIKANYGHSIEGIDPDYQEVEPPEVLYHGTRPEVKENIKIQGLQPMSRNYVHLSRTVAEAEKVARRRTNQPVIIKVEARQAYAEGIRFYRAGTRSSGQGGVEIYLVKRIGPEHLEF
ncbi:MAG: RNA 2'-phosphotransferase [Bacillota bacterium]